VWTGTSADSEQLGTAGIRFKQYRNYAMPNQYLMVSYTSFLHTYMKTLTNAISISSTHILDAELEWK